MLVRYILVAMLIQINHDRDYMKFTITVIIHLENISCQMIFDVICGLVNTDTRDIINNGDESSVLGLYLIQDFKFISNFSP